MERTWLKVIDLQVSYRSSSHASGRYSEDQRVAMKQARQDWKKHTRHIKRDRQKQRYIDISSEKNVLSRSIHERGGVAVMTPIYI